MAKARPNRLKVSCGLQARFDPGPRISYIPASRRSRPPRGGVLFLTSSAAEPQPGTEPASDFRDRTCLRTRRPDVRAGRRLLADDGRRRALPRFRRRHRRRLARPFAPASRRDADLAGRKALAHVEPVPDARGRAAGERLADATFADLVFFANSGAEANEAAIKMARAPLRRTAIPSAFASSPSRAPSTAARWRRSRPAARPNISKVSGRRSRASTRSRSPIWRRSRRRSSRRRRRS